MQGLEFVYEFIGDKIYKSFEIPDLELASSYAFHSKMFAFNQSLCVSNKNGHAFECDMKTGKLSRKRSFKFAEAYSFANNTIVWHPFDKVEELKSDGKLKKICDCKQMNWFSFCGGGIAVFHNIPFTIALVIDMVNMRAFQTTKKFLEQTSIRQSLELGLAGLQIQDSVAIEICGPLFLV